MNLIISIFYQLQHTTCYSNFKIIQDINIFDFGASKQESPNTLQVLNQQSFYTNFIPVLKVFGFAVGLVSIPINDYALPLSNFKSHS